MFSFNHWFLLLFSSAFIVDCICFSSLFLQVFLFHWFHYCFSSVFISPTSFKRDYFLSRTLFLCCFTVSAADLGELFSLSGVFRFTLLCNIWHSLLLSRLPWGLQYNLEGYRASYLGSKHRSRVCSINVLRLYGTLY